MSLLALPLDVQRLLLHRHLCDEDAFITRCACRALRALVPRARIDVCRHRLYEHCCTQGYTALLAWLYAQVPPRESHVSALCAMAAQGGHLTALQWLRAHGALCDDLTCTYAARGGHLTMLQWLHADGAPWNDEVCAMAAQGGHLAVLQWAYAHGAPWHEQTCTYAAMNGHLATLQWARKHGAPWDAWTCASAAQGGHLAVLEWAREHGAP